MSSTRPRATRATWRDAIKADDRLRRDAVLVGLLMADYIKDDSPEPLWAVVDVLMKQSRMSRAALYRAQKELRDVGYLHQLEAAKHGRAPRWRPILPAPRVVEDSQTETDWSPPETKRSQSETRNHTQTLSTPNVGSEDQDPESRRISRLKPANAAERADLRKLAKYTTNLPTGVAETLWGWMRTGRSLSGRPNSEVDRPGATAAKLHKKATAVPGVSEWQGWFHRHYMTEDQRDSGFRLQIGEAQSDPWATSA